MSVQRWASRCPGPGGGGDCDARWDHEVVIHRKVVELPARSVVETQAWLVECEYGHTFVVDAAKDKTGEYHLVIP